MFGCYWQILSTFSRKKTWSNLLKNYVGLFGKEEKKRLLALSCPVCPSSCTVSERTLPDRLFVKYHILFFLLKSVNIFRLWLIIWREQKTLCLKAYVCLRSVAKTGPHQWVKWSSLSSEAEAEETIEHPASVISDFKCTEHQSSRDVGPKSSPFRYLRLDKLNICCLNMKLCFILYENTAIFWKVFTNLIRVEKNRTKASELSCSTSIS